MARAKTRAGPLADASLYMVEVRARNFAAMCAFYGGTLGLPEKMRDGGAGFAMFGGKEPYIAVVRKESADEGPSKVVPDLVVSGLERALEELTRAGVRVVSPPHASPEGYRIATVADPEGNEIHLFEWAVPKAP